MPSSTAARLNQTCQCENKPLEIANWPVRFKSAAIRQQPRAQAIKAAGAIRAASASAMCRFLRRFRFGFGPWRSRNRTIISVESQFTNYLENRPKGTNHYAKAENRDYRHRIHGQGPCRRSTPAGKRGDSRSGSVERRESQGIRREHRRGPDHWRLQNAAGR